MDKIYPPDKFPCSELISLKNFHMQYSTMCGLNTDPDFERMTKKEQDETLCNMLKIKNKKMRKEFLRSISVDLLTVEGETPPENVPSTSSSNKAVTRVKEPLKITDESLVLETVKMRLNYKDKFHNIYMKHKQRNEPYVCPAAEKSNENNIDQGSEFAAAIRIYEPFDFNYSNPNSSTNLKFSHELVALGSNTLADVRDKIICHLDAGLSVEVEDPKMDMQIADAKEKYPSGFIFIENVFYNDLRHPNSFDYSEVIRQWAAEKGIGPLQYGNLENTRIDDLTVRFGYPYVYQHQGKCEHILVFSDAWLLTCKDSLNSQDYPSYTGIHRFYSKHCTICYLQGAKWIVINSERLPHAKTFLCQECFLSYNYKDVCKMDDDYKDGKKIGEFKTYPFPDRSVM